MINKWAVILINPTFIFQLVSKWDHFALRLIPINTQSTNKD